MDRLMIQVGAPSYKNTGGSKKSHYLQEKCWMSISKTFEGPVSVLQLVNYKAISSNWTTIRNKQQGSYSFLHLIHIVK